MHFLRKSEVYARTLTRPRAAVKVKLEKDKLVVSGPDDEGKPNIFVAKMDTQWAKVPDRIKVVGPDGKVIKPSKGTSFYVSTETFDPYHMVLEASEDLF